MCKSNLKIAAIIASALILAAQVTRVINAEEKSKEGTAERNGIYEIMVD